MYLRRIVAATTTLQEMVDSVCNAYNGSGSVDVKEGSVFGSLTKIAADTWQYSRADWLVDIVVTGNTLYLKERLGGAQVQTNQVQISMGASVASHIAFVFGDDFVAAFGSVSNTGSLGMLAIRLPVDSQYGGDTSVLAMFNGTSEQPTKQYPANASSAIALTTGFNSLLDPYPTSSTYFHKASGAQVQPARATVLCTVHGAAKILDWLRGLPVNTLPADIAIIDGNRYVAYGMLGKYIRID